MIFCLSQQHTGTWSTLAWVRDHKQVRGLVTFSHLFDALERREAVVHPMESGDLKARWHPTMVYHEHVRPDRIDPFRIHRSQVLLASMTPTVIPIRDPLAALISYQVRAEMNGGPGFDPIGQHIEGWLRLAETARTVLAEFGHIKFLCWDLAGEMDRTGRYIYLREIARDLGLTKGLLGEIGDGPSAQCGVKVIRNNDLGSYPLKVAYQARDTAALRAGIAEGAFDYLALRERELRPFLEGLGYRNLLWWSEG